MATTASPISQSPLSQALHACVQCRTSKKKCDKSLLVCSRCSRLSLPCNYEDAEAAVPLADTQSQFRSVFDRLERLEELVLTSRERGAATSSTPKIFATRTRTDVPDAKQWQISPHLLDPSYLDVIASANVVKILEERGLTVQEVGRLYFSTIHNFMPILSKESFDRRVREVESLSPRGHFFILILAIILLTDNPTHAGPAASPASLPSQLTSYRVCKYHFSLLTSFKDPTIELIQAGLCIALYEYEQCVSDQAYLTIGTCARMASLLRLYSTDHASESGCDQDVLNVTMAIQLLDTHINMAWRLLDKHNGSEYTRIVACSDTGQVMRPFGRELQACRILDGLQQLLYQEGLMNGSSTTQLMSLEGELANIQISFDDHEGFSTWRGEIATAAVASLLVRSLIYHKGETHATGQAFNERPTKIVKDIRVLETMSRYQLHRITAEGSINTMSPFSMTILALGACYIKSLCPSGLIENYEWCKGNAVVELLQWLSGRWCLAKKLLEIL